VSNWGSGLEFPSRGLGPRPTWDRVKAQTQRAARSFTPSVSQGGRISLPADKGSNTGSSALLLSWRGSQISQRRYGGSIEGRRNSVTWQQRRRIQAGEEAGQVDETEVSVGSPVGTTSGAQLVRYTAASSSKDEDNVLTFSSNLHGDSRRTGSRQHSAGFWLQLGRESCETRSVLRAHCRLSA
jgi:hypothetical protein